MFIVSTSHVISTAPPSVYRAFSSDVIRTMVSDAWTRVFGVSSGALPWFQEKKRART